MLLGLAIFLGTRLNGDSGQNVRIQLDSTLSFWGSIEGALPCCGRQARGPQVLTPGLLTPPPPPYPTISPKNFTRSSHRSAHGINLSVCPLAK